MPKSKRKRRRSTSQSGYFGVKKAPSGKYQARIFDDGKTKHIGSSYTTAKQAAKAHDKEAIRLRRPFSKLNFPEKAPSGYAPMQQQLQVNNTVGYRGVYKNRRKQRIHWQAQIMVDRSKKYIGTYDTAIEAAVAYDRFVLESNHSTSLLNFPDMVHNLDVEPKRKKYKRSLSGYRGVTKEASGKFRSSMKINCKRVNFGMFDTAIQAALAYDQGAIKAGHKKSSLNFPMEEKDEKKQEKIQKKRKQKKQKKRKKQIKIENKDVLTMEEYEEMLQASM